MAPIAALYDVHGNLPALDAALAAAEAAGAREIIVGGDVVLGPMPREALERLQALGPRARFLRGNCDRLVVSAFDGEPLDRMPARLRGPVEWTAAQLDRSHRDFLAALPTTLTAEAPGLGEVLFCHATPRNDEEIFTVRSPDERVRPMLAGVTQSVVVCGHTHMQFDRRVGDVRVLNAGSVGMPYGRRGAHWLLLDDDARHQRTDYDYDAAAARVRATAYPNAEDFASRSVLDPQSEEEILALFERS
ncbi:Calcineurin-like phosphoesterase superfamily domain protein [Gemmatirosa kalamazoonensis]|uniref:Calcineurin-like phosphoesterase superfamily domain protein n=1 Tax=Gemmatirosa kalamazoonensis TaxID=861299 RepID=W0RGL4_9BACT|nr:metallophosphoesterase family protein [Gemmatirosa kalamazoonensis]AHG89577.1 Calcineurin-like phosphoesterase superfamily domain protein [Gemmatirosa kalamazoonensis]